MSDANPLQERIIALIEALKNKRAKIVGQHLLQHGSITTQEITELYGYKHPPRAVRDLREAGIPIETFSTSDSDGKTIAAYRLGNLELIREGRLAGRRVFPKRLKLLLYQQQQGRCAVCNSAWEMRYLQIDHRIPYEVAGESRTENTNAYQLLCGECNRAKSWSCEHCPNFKTLSVELCEGCYWVTPTNYQHIATTPTRRIILTWNQEETHYFDDLNQEAKKLGLELPDYLKFLLKSHLKRD